MLAVAVGVVPGWRVAAGVLAELGVAFEVRVGDTGTRGRLVCEGVLEAEGTWPGGRTLLWLGVLEAEQVLVGERVASAVWLAVADSVGRAEDEASAVILDDGDKEGTAVEEVVTVSDPLDEGLLVWDGVW